MAIQVYFGSMFAIIRGRLDMFRQELLDEFVSPTDVRTDVRYVSASVAYIRESYDSMNLQIKAKLKQFRLALKLHLSVTCTSSSEGSILEFYDSKESCIKGQLDSFRQKLQTAFTLPMCVPTTVQSLKQSYDSMYTFIDGNMSSLRHELCKLQISHYAVCYELKEHYESMLTGLSNRIELVERELLLLEARRCGYAQCEFLDGAVWVIAEDGSRYQIQSKSDLDKIPTSSKSTGSRQQCCACTTSQNSKDLESEPQPKRRRLRRGLIVDQTIKIRGDEFAVRIANEDVEQRCESTKEDIIDVKRVSAATLLSRQWASAKLGHALSCMFTRGYYEDKVEEALVPRPSREPVEEDIQAVDKTQNQNQTVQEPDIQDQVLQDISNRDVSVRNATEAEVVPYAQEAIEMADLPTQKVLTATQEKRASALERPAKRKCTLRSSTLNEKEREVNKENIPGAENIPVQEQIYANIPSIVLPTDEPVGSNVVGQLNSMLGEAGLVDTRDKPADAEPATLTQRKTTNGSEGSETPLGSLDRTKVSLGDSVKTTDSKRFLDEEWGVQGTMLKIFRCVVKRLPRITVETLVQRGPVLADQRNIVMARCFDSILKLKTHGFIKVIKVQETLAIQHIELGPRLTKYGNK